MAPPRRTPEPPAPDLAAELVRVGRQAGLDAVGIAGAEPFEDARRALEEGKVEGRHGGMQFTYRHPARSTDPGRALAGARSLVVGARRYVRQDPPRGRGQGPAGRVARYSWVDHYAPLRAALEVVGARLQEAGYRSRVLADDNALVDRAAAHRAGLGWYGKNTNLLLPGAGSWFVLGSVVTDAALPASAPTGGSCGTCQRCLPACPTGALVAPGVLDARRCLAWLLQAPGTFPVRWREAVGDRIYGCDDCQEACPPNRSAARRSPPPPAEEGAEPTVDALAILDLDDAELLKHYGRWYIPARQPRYLRRNALLVLGNAGDPDDDSVVRAVAGALGHDDELVRAHAVWAAARLGLTGLLGMVAGDPDPQVRAELSAVDSVRGRRPAPSPVAGSDDPRRANPPPTSPFPLVH
jgi:epoxyqueuosine reductase